MGVARWGTRTSIIDDVYENESGDDFEKSQKPKTPADTTHLGDESTNISFT